MHGLIIELVKYFLFDWRKQIRGADMPRVSNLSITVLV
jgi:hypothetical protein